MAEVLSPLRTGRITGSRVASILGLNPYQSRDDAMRAFVRELAGLPSEFTGNEATEYGRKMEPTVLAMYEARIGEMTYGGEDLVLHPEYPDLIAVTPDGLVGDDGLVECKAPFRGRYTHYEKAAYYVPQMHLQMHCTGRKWCDFAVLHRDGTLHVSRLHFEPNWLTENLPALTSFVEEGKAIAANPELLKLYG